MLNRGAIAAHYLLYAVVIAMAASGLAIVLSLTIIGHVLAALYHQYVRKDSLFFRMWFGGR